MAESVLFGGGRLRFIVDENHGARRLSEFLGHLVQVNRLCILLGSGASFHLGSPTIRSVSAEDLRTLCDAAGVELTEGSSALLDRLVVGQTDLEGLLGRLAAAVNFARSFGTDQVEVAGAVSAASEVHALFGAVNVALAAACQLPQGELPAPVDEDPWLAHREFFRRILAARRPDAPRTKVFTTNYDTVIERSLDSCGIRYFDGFVGGVSRSLDLTSYGNDLFTRPGPDAPLLPVHDLVHLYKVHGSLTWRASGGGSTAPLRIVQAAGPPSPGELAMIYPTPTKELDVVGYPYADLLREFGVSLSAPESALLVVGYGFADDHINRLIYQALSFNSTLQVFVADPFGVVPQDALLDEEPIARADTAVGRLSQIEDARISVLTGDAATFTRLATSLPDVAGSGDDHREKLSQDLARALLDERPDDES